MRRTNKNNWAAEKRSMERAFNFITGDKTKIIDIVPPENALGYTCADKTIHLAYDHPAMDGLSANERAAFRKGVFCHELLHQVFTSFSALESALVGLKGPERRIFSLISNVLEDPAIEYWAPTAVSGPLLHSLRFSIAHIYKNSPDINTATTAFGQYVSALIQFGDMGLLKGTFTFPEAKQIFAKTANLFEEGVKEPIAEKRMDFAKQIFEISRPLWQEQADMEQAMQELAEMLSEQGKSAMSGSGNGQNGDPSAVSDTEKDKRRKITVKKISKEEMEELKKKEAPVPGPLPEDGDVTIYVCDDETEEKTEENEDGAGASVAAPDNKEHNEEDTDENDSAEAENEDTALTGASDEIEGAESGESKAGPSQSTSNDSSNNETSDRGSEQKDGEKEDGTKDDDQEKGEPSRLASKDNPFAPQNSSPSLSGHKPENTAENEDAGEEDCSIDDDEYRISKDDIASILSEIEREKEEITKEAEAETDNSAIPDYDISSGKMPKKSCLNYRVSFCESDRANLETAYAHVINKMSTGIHTTTKALKRIFEDDKEEREYRTSGRVSLKRLYSGTVTDHIFEKKIAPADKSDLAVEILVDESGSMKMNQKYVAARECCIALSEIFKNLNVPVYVIGFTADCMGYDVVHSHYVTWKNTKDDRLKLLNISARADNCDGASIRYGTEVIKKKQAKNKLLIVISDGSPAAYNYSNGDADTKDAVKAAKKHTSVLGVAIGNNDTEKIQYFYEKDFLHVSDVNELFAGIVKAIKKIIKTW